MFLDWGKRCFWGLWRYACGNLTCIDLELAGGINRVPCGADLLIGINPYSGGAGIGNLLRKQLIAAELTVVQIEQKRLPSVCEGGGEDDGLIAQRGGGLNCANPTETGIGIIGQAQGKWAEFGGICPRDTSKSAMVGAGNIRHAP